MSTTPEGKEALLPCPFCGATASGYSIEPHAHALRLGDFKMPDHPGSYVIEGDCACGSGLIGATREEVTERWNRRAATPSALSAAPKGEVAQAQRKETWQHIANEWADMATSAMQAVRNIQDGITTPADVLANLNFCYSYCAEVQSRAAPQPPAPEAVLVDADSLRVECGASPEEWADFKRWRHAQRDARAALSAGKEEKS